MSNYKELLTKLDLPILNGLNESQKKFIIMCYHKDSDLVSKYKDKLKDKWVEAKAKTGYKGEASDLYEYISKFLISQNDAVWQQLCSCQSTFNEYQEIILKPLQQSADDDKLLKAASLKSKLIDDCDKLIDKIDSYLSKVFEKDKSLINIVKTKPISPENISTFIT
jgi:hypothetical protein